MYLYLTIDSKGNTFVFYLSCKRDAKAAKRFLERTLASCHITKPCLITADVGKFSLVVIRELKDESVYHTVHHFV
ncbi:hypothetical protein IK5_05930 [Bacillus cereus VD154]|uniref:DDE domain-containing protein n=1 Tax=Bacillus cereus VD154 TaxID=1053238 RepID=A0A9W5KR50_BACCE|nr:hypothetical protein IK5_05930 [Bacillus cereus VD154]